MNQYKRTGLTTGLFVGTAFVLSMISVGAHGEVEEQQRYPIPIVDLADDTARQVIVDREAGQYLGHVTTVLLEDGKTMYATYPRGHGRGGIVLKRSDDGGLTWSDRLPVPASWSTSREVPTIHRVVDANGKKRLILWSGLYPARMSVSEDDGRTWSELTPAGDWGGILVMSALFELRTGPGHYMALFHDNGLYFTKDGKKTDSRTLYKSISRDGGLSWSFPEVVWHGSDVHLVEPGAIRSPDGKQIAVLLRENSRRKNSHIIFSSDEGETWSEPRELPITLTGDRHAGKYGPDGRLVITFRDCTYTARSGTNRDVDKLDKGSPTEGDWVAWVGTYEDLVTGSPGQYRLRLMDNLKGWDTCYPGLEVLEDGTFVATTYGHWTAGEQPYIVSVRFGLDEFD